MNQINELVNTSKKIGKYYLELIRKEVQNNPNDMDSIKTTISFLAQKENILISEIFLEKDKIKELSDFLDKSADYNKSIHQKILESIGEKDPSSLVIDRIFRKYSAKLASLKPELLTEFKDENLLNYLNLSSIGEQKLSYINTVNWNLTYLLNATSSKLKYRFLLERIGESSYTEDGRNNLIYYKNLFVFSNPNLETYLLEENELLSGIPTFILPKEDSSQEYQKIHHYIIHETVMDEIQYQLTNLLNLNTYSSLYNKHNEILNTIYLSSFTALLFLLPDEEYYQIKENVKEQLDALLEKVEYHSIIKIEILLNSCFEKREKEINIQNKK